MREPRAGVWLSGHQLGTAAASRSSSVPVTHWWPRTAFAFCFSMLCHAAGCRSDKFLLLV
jgi:hypothetical protein